MATMLWCGESFTMYSSMVLVLAWCIHSAAATTATAANIFHFQPTKTATCLSNPEFTTYFEELVGTRIPSPGSCCMKDVCGLECPQEISDPAGGYGLGVAVAVFGSLVVGMGVMFFVESSVENFFVAGRKLPLWMATITFVAQAIDSNATLGSADLSYRFSFWDGAVFPLGLGLSLILNSIFLAHKIHQDQVFTLPDVFAKRYGATVEILVSLTTICSFLMLLAGNLVGFGTVAGYLWGISTRSAIWLASTSIFIFTMSGGLVSVAYTNVVQIVVGYTGLVVATFYLIHNEEASAPPSIGFPTYVYPDSFGEGGACDMYNGVPCTTDSTKCCYNIEKWCPAYAWDGPCTRYDRGAYPFGDERVPAHAMTSFTALSPFPNAIVWNWATIFILGIGNLAALDFQQRCMGSDSPRTARLGCLYAGLITLLVGIPFAAMGSISRVYYGPDSVHSTFEADSCASQLGLPTCASWIPDLHAFVYLLTHQAPGFLGGWCLIGIIAASMSTAQGAILALGTVSSHNLLRHLEGWFPNAFNPDNVVLWARVSSLPLTWASTLIAAYYRSSNGVGNTGYLLIVAFDVVFGTVVVPLFGAFYAKRPSSCAALLAILGGAFTRILLEFTLPKDGSLIAPFDSVEFLNYGSAASPLKPAFLDVVQEEKWDEAMQPCDQKQYKDFTGVDSMAGFFVCLIVFLSVQWLENYRGRTLFHFPGSRGYEKKQGLQLVSKNKTIPVGTSKTPPAKSKSESKENSVHQVDASNRTSGGSSAHQDPSSGHVDEERP